MASKFFKNIKFEISSYKDQEKISLYTESLFKQLEYLKNDQVTEIITEAFNISNTKNLIEHIFTHSPYLSTILIRELPFFSQIITEGLDHSYAHFCQNIHKAEKNALFSYDELRRFLRLSKRKVALLIAIADILTLWPQKKVTQALSDFADFSINTSLRFLLEQEHGKETLIFSSHHNIEKNSGIIVLAVGKLGGCELNYSSDVDLIFLYDLQKISSSDPHMLQPILVKLVKKFVTIMQDITADGYVFRVDLRLRPDPGSTPIIISTDSAENYYSAVGQNWERAALIKARACAGDVESAANFLQNIHNFIWRKHLDFMTIRDTHAMKRQVYRQHGGETIQIEGHNIKLGRGGIRDIEFYVQTEQLIWGGRKPNLKSKNTCKSLISLADIGRISKKRANELIKTYDFLRTLEHRIQMIADKQTHTLPEKKEGLLKLSYFMGFEDYEKFRNTLLKHFKTVEKSYAGLFEKKYPLAVEGNLVFTGVEDDPGTSETLLKMGFQDPSRVQSLIRGWHHGRYNVTKSEHARQLLTDLIPNLLLEMSKTVHPDRAFINFDEFLKKLPLGVQFFSLLNQNRNFLSFLIEIMGSAPRLASYLSHYTHTFDTLLLEPFKKAFPNKRHLKQEFYHWLEQTTDYEDVLNLARQWAKEKQFLIGVRLLRMAISTENSYRYYTHVAEVLINIMISIAEKEFLKTSTKPKGCSMAILALGRLGSQELTATSDLDLIFIFDTGRETKNNLEIFEAKNYYTRLCRRIITSLNAQTAGGKIYDIDLRLRPSGNKGPIAVHIDTFEQYQLNEAWTWEHMALTRSRVIHGSPQLRQKINKVILNTLCQKKDINKIKKRVSDMRQKVDSYHHTNNPWRLKYVRGGLMDIEFIIQYLQLKNAQNTPDCLKKNMRETIDYFKEASILTSQEAKTLKSALKLWQTIQAYIRLTLHHDFDEKTAPEGLKKKLVHITKSRDFDDLITKMSQTREKVYKLYNDFIEDTNNDRIDRKKSS